MLSNHYDYANQLKSFDLLVSCDNNPNRTLFGITGSEKYGMTLIYEL